MLLAWAVLTPDLPQFSGKAFTGRAIAYPIALIVLPVGWWIVGRGRLSYPVAADMLLGRVAAAGRTVGIVDARRPGVRLGGQHAVAWELAEYVAFVPDSPEAATADRYASESA